MTHEQLCFVHYIAFLKFEASFAFLPQKKNIEKTNELKILKNILLVSFLYTEMMPTISENRSRKFAYSCQAT